MAFQAQQIDIAPLEQARIRRAVRQVAGNATFGFYGRMFKRERPGFIGMAPKADLILRCRRTKLMRQETTVRIVAVTARNQAFIHAMMDRPRELRHFVQMTAITELRLGGFQQSGFDFC